MAGITIQGSNAATQFAVAVALLLTFSLGMKTGRHVAYETRTTSQSRGEATLGPHFPYELGQPVRKLALPAILKEASAVSYIDGTNVGMVQDENGVLFIYSLLENRIVKQIPFAAQGDFEGLVVINNEAWILRSDGDLFHLVDIQNPALDARKLENFLKDKDDTEGLALDAAHGQLLIGLKEPAKLEGKRDKRKRAVFAYDMKQETLGEKPYLLLDTAQIKRVYQTQVGGGKAEKFDADNKKAFQPSDLAIHPVTGHIYHIASRGQLLVVSDHSGLVHYVRELPKSMFRQPEGIAFDPRGNMFIVNEGKGSNAILLEFSYKPLAPKPVEQEADLKFGLYF